MRHLDIVTCVSNPIGWESRGRLARKAILSWLEEPEVRVTLVRCAHGSRPHDFDDLKHPRLAKIDVRQATLAWAKENLLNIGISRLPPDARALATFDADITFREPGWASRIVHALDLYPVIQPWTQCIDLGPRGETLTVHKSFASLFHAGKPIDPHHPPVHGPSHVIPPYDFPHPGYAWAWVIDILNAIGGLFELGAIGSGDHHMAAAIAGQVEKSLPGELLGSYAEHARRWARSADHHINGKLGFVTGTIEHHFHGPKEKRGYQTRWEMFLRHKFDPVTDLKRNVHGVIEFSGSKPKLEREFDNYLRARAEDDNSF
jgi:hypothetical protein